MPDKQTTSHSDTTSTLGRRKFLQTSALAMGAGAAAISLGTSAMACINFPTQLSFDKFTLPALPYGYDALESIIDQETMKIHHGKHHQAYIDKLNAAVGTAPELASKSVEDLLRGLDKLPEAIRGAVRNHGGGHANHSLFWQVMRPVQQNNAPSGKLAEKIKSTFESFENFKTTFAANAVGQFGSGWSWLVSAGDKLELLATPNQDSPISVGKRPLLGLDVWEHAYYLKYQNRRADYVQAWWDVVNWDQVAKNLAGEKSGS